MLVKAFALLYTVWLPRKFDERKKENKRENFKFEPRDTRQVLNKLTLSVSVFTIPIF